MTTAAELASYASSFPSFRNRIINGNFEIWQRGNTSRTFGIAGVYSYSADRWCRSGYQSAAHERVTVSSPVAGMTSRYAIRSSSCTTAEDANGSRMTVAQKIESVNCYDLAEKQITFSFWIRFSSTASSLGSSFNSRIQYNTSTTDSPTSSDAGGDGYICRNDFLSTSLPTTWTKISTTGLVPAGVQNLTARFQFSNLVSTASAGSEWFEITEVQVEEGSVPTPFEHRPYGMELALCQRYFQISPAYTYLPAVNGGTTNVETNFFLLTPMRATPTFSTSTGSYDTSIFHVNTRTIGTSTPFNINYATNSNIVRFNQGGFSGMNTVDQSCTFQSRKDILISAEL